MTDQQAIEVMGVSTRAHLTEDALTRLNIANIREAVDSGDVPAIDIADFGNGFALLNKEEKGRLCDVPFYIVDWKFNSTPAGDFVTLFIITNDDERYIINDGGTGIFAQMKRMHEQTNGQHAYIAVPKGLTKSEYTYNDNGKERPAVTYYLSLSR